VHISLRVIFYRLICRNVGHAAGGAVRLGTALQAGRSLVRFPMVSLEFFNDIIIPAALWPWGSTQFLINMSTRNI
jgi:hypothetical protein